MSATLSCSACIELLRRHALLEPARLDELARLAAADATAQTLGKLILERDWLTSFQVNRLLLGRVDELFIGQYLLQAKLGEGGMGQVFRALDRTMGRVVALKLIRPDVLNSQQAVERFLKEIRAAAGLDHPNIIRAYHAGCLGNAHFLIMEYAEGTDLHRRLREGHPLAVASVCDWGRQAALALQHVGERGMVHRDVKPMNLLLTVHGVVKLLDMGLARSHSLAEAADAENATRQGSMMGTADYVAPEQIVDASRVDIRADIYSLGCTLHHLLAGSPPFPGSERRDKLRRHLAGQAESLERLRADVPATLADLVRWMMRKEPGERPQTPAKVAAALEKFIAPQTSGTSPAAPSSANSVAATIDYQMPGNAGRRRSWLAATVVAVAVALVLFVLWNPFAVEPIKPDEGPAPKDLAQRKEPSKPERQDPPELPPELPRQQHPVAVPPRQPPPWKERLPWQPAELVQVIGDERGRHWGPVSLVVWSGDGRRLASSGYDGIRVWDAATLRELCTLKDGQQQATVMALSGDGKRLVVVSYSDDGQVWDLAGAQPRKEGPLKMTGTILGKRLTALQFSPDGKTLTGLTTRGGMVNWSTKRLDRQPDEVVPADDSVGTRLQTLNRQGTRLARLAMSDRTTVFLRNVGAPGGKETAVPEVLGQGRSLALSPDGQTLAVTVGSDHTSLQGPSGLRLWKIDHEPARELARYNRATSGMSHLTFSADGTWLAAAAGSDVIVWRIHEAGPAQHLEIKGHGRGLLSLAFSPVGTVLASAGNDGCVRLWDVSQPAPELDSAAWKAHDLAFSADGKRLASALRTLAIRSSVDVTSRIRVQSLDAPQDAHEADFQGFLNGLTFSPDSSRLVLYGTAAGQRQSKKRMWGVMEVRDAHSLKLLHERGFDEDVFGAHFHDGGKLCTLLTISNYRSGNSRVVFRQFDTASWKELGSAGRSTPFGAVAPDVKLGMTRETGNEGGVGKTDEIVIWDLGRLADDALPEKKRFTLGASHFSWDHLHALSPDGARLASVGVLRQIELWDTVTGRRLGSSKMGYAKITGLAFSPNGSLLATVDDYRRVAVWRTDGAALTAHREPWTFPGTVHALAFDPSGHFLALANANGTVYLLRVQ